MLSGEEVVFGLCGVGSIYATRRSVLGGQPGGFKILEGTFGFKGHNIATIL
jgi:hypothetical protein